MKGLGMVGKIMCESLCGDEDGREWRVWILKEGNGKRKMERKIKKRNEVGNKINGDGYGDKKWMGERRNRDWGVVYINK